MVQVTRELATRKKKVVEEWTHKKAREQPSKVEERVGAEGELGCEPQWPHPHLGRTHCPPEFSSLKTSISSSSS